SQVYDEADSSYDSEILSEVHDHDHYQDDVCEHHEEHEMHENVQPNHVVDSHADYTGDSHMISYDQYVKDNAVPGHNTEDTLELAEITRRKMYDKMKNPECVKHKVKIAPHDYSKENFLETFTPQKQLTIEQIFWSQDLIKMKAEALKEQTTASRPIKALTVYPPNKPATLVPRVLPTNSQVKINIFTLIQLFLEFDKTYKKRITPIGLTEGERGFEQTNKCYLKEVIPFFKTLKEHFEGIKKALTKEIKEMKDVFEELEVEVDQNVVDRKHHEIEWKNLLIANDNLIVDCLSKEVFYVATNSELNVSRFTEMHVANTIVEARCLELKTELSNLRDKSHNDNHNELVNRFSNLETRSEADRTLDFRALDSQITQLTKKVTVLQEQNDLFRAENGKIKQHYKELYDSIKITCAKHIEHVRAMTTKNVNLKAQILNNVNNVIKDHVKPTVLAPGKYAIDVKPVPPCLRNNREVHLDYLRHLKESVETIHEIVEEAKVIRPLDSSIVSACRYTKHSHELLEYAIGTYPQDSHQRDRKHAPAPLIRKKNPTKIRDPTFQTLHLCLVLNAGRTDRPLVFRLRLFKTYNEDRSRLINFMKKFIGTVRFRNDHFGAVMGYGDYVIGDSVIYRVYYVEGLGHNLFSVGQFCDSDLEVAFRKHSCYVRDTDGVELIKGSRGSNLYTISVKDMMKSSLICLLSKASKNKSWLWHRCLNHLNFDTINDLARKNPPRTNHGYGTYVDRCECKQL
nr:integrase, catalytic region, zinc finger, CCHC-type, peptidase aspartic, catalytic [Tanacetum cinerariifolium]